MRPTAAALLPAMILLTGCVVGPNYTRPSTPVPPAFRDAPPATAQEAASFADLPWWQVFRDPVLQNLIRAALEKNYDLRIATEQIAAAREQVVITHANQLPQVSAGGSFSGGRNALSGATRFTNVLSITGDVSYQLDLFGGLRSANEAARAQLLASEEARRAVVMTLVSDVAMDYYQLLSLDLQLRTARQTIESQTESVRLTGLRVERGAATRVDSLQAQQVLDSANARIPELEREASRYENALSLLLGNYPEAVPRGAVLTEQYLAPEVPAGLTSALLERRPDIRQAEKRLIYYNAEIGVAKAALYPQIALTGTAGVSAILTSTVAAFPAIWTYGGSIAQTVFNGGALRARVRVVESDERQALLSYAQTIQKAFGEVADALTDYRKYHELRLRQEQVVETLEASLRLALMRYRGGVTTYLEVLNDQLALFSAQLTLAQARGSEYQSVVELYKALGGGWQEQSQP
jgi:outer membrane protein, multidrug efflux system